MGTGCSYSGYTVYPYINNLGYAVEDYQDDVCNFNSPYQLDDTYFAVSSGWGLQWVYAQADTWLTQGPSCCGHTRYGETGRSELIAYPANGRLYYVQAAIYYGWKAPMYGCNWVNFPDYATSYDYNCGYLE